ncbi:MAG: AAA family ATPase [Desulfobacterota bacterium]|nr:AAA family ATPase [Thermodesulfobacteriota bacterium]
MYLDFYGLKEKPFSLTPDPQFLYLSENHRTAIESLLYGIRQREGFMVVTGDVGTGKTTLCRALIEKLDGRVKTAVIFNSFLTEGELLRAILQDLGFKAIGRTKAERIDALNRYLLDQLSQGHQVLLIIDEAQNLSVPVLEQIRMLSNLETTKEKLLQVILFGQLELDQKLRSPKLKQLNQRIALRQHLLPLDRKETEAYIYQRLAVAGSHGGITFSKAALDQIYRYSKGIPRLINLLCDRILLGGFVEEVFHFDRRLVKRAIEDLGGNGKDSRFSSPSTWKRFFPPLRIVLLTILCLLLTGMLILNFGPPSSLREAQEFIHDRFGKLYRKGAEEKPSLFNPSTPHGDAQRETIWAFSEELR